MPWSVVRSVRLRARRVVRPFDAVIPNSVSHSGLRRSPWRFITFLNSRTPSTTFSALPVYRWIAAMSNQRPIPPRRYW